MTRQIETYPYLIQKFSLGLACDTAGDENRKEVEELLLLRNKFETFQNSLLAPYYVENINDLVLRTDLFRHRTDPEFGEKLSKLYGRPSNQGGKTKRY